MTSLYIWMYEARTIKVVWISKELHLSFSRTECIWKYPRQLWEWFLFRHRAYCNWSLPWCMFSQCLSVHKQIWWHCSLQGRYKQTILQYFRKLIVAMPHHRTRDRMCTRASCSCMGCQYTFTDLIPTTFTSCSIQKAELLCGWDGLEQWRWICLLPTIVEEVVLLLLLLWRYR